MGRHRHRWRHPALRSSVDPGRPIIHPAGHLAVSHQFPYSVRLCGQLADETSACPPLAPLGSPAVSLPGPRRHRCHSPSSSTRAMPSRSVISHAFDTDEGSTVDGCVCPSQQPLSCRVCVAAGDQASSPSLSSCVHDDGCDREAITQLPGSYLVMDAVASGEILSP